MSRPIVAHLNISRRHRRPTSNERETRVRTLFYHKWDEHNFLFCVILFFYDLSFIVEGQRDYCVIVVVTTFILFLNNFLVSLLCNTTFFYDIFNGFYISALESYMIVKTSDDNFL